MERASYEHEHVFAVIFFIDPESLIRITQIIQEIHLNMFANNRIHKIHYRPMLYGAFCFLQNIFPTEFQQRKCKLPKI